jgi:hypothetical protein
MPRLPKEESNYGRVDGYLWAENYDYICQFAFAVQRLSRRYCSTMKALNLVLKRAREAGFCAEDSEGGEFRPGDRKALPRRRGRLEKTPA